MKVFILIISRNWLEGIIFIVWNLLAGFCFQILEQLCFSQMNVLLHVKVHLMSSIIMYGQCNVWTNINPHVTYSHTQQHFSIYAWAGIIGNHLLRSYLLPECIHGKKYLTICKTGVSRYVKQNSPKHPAGWSASPWSMVL